jgi:hypothetical protein
MWYDAAYYEGHTRILPQRWAATLHGTLRSPEVSEVLRAFLAELYTLIDNIRQARISRWFRVALRLSKVPLVKQSAASQA